LRAVELLDSELGRERLAHLHAMTQRFRTGLADLGYESLPGEHPVVPVVVRDTPRTCALTAHLRRSGVLATGLTFPVVPQGEEEVRFQLSADHTPADIDQVLDALASFAERS
jgi:glycine C-acetyltransferase